MEGIITDEQGHLLDQVLMTVAWYQPRSYSNPEPKAVGRQTMTINGHFEVALGRFDHLTVAFSKAGYADGGWALYADSDYHADFTRRSLEGGGAEPRSDGGPGVRIVMHPAHYQWDPPGMSDKLMGMLNRKRDWPAEAPKGMPLIADSSDPRMVAAPETGTYMLTDSEGKILAMRRVRRGMRIGFQRIDDGTVKRIISTVGGSGFPSPTAKTGPYRWSLYSKAQPILPATQPAGAPVAPAPATAPAAQVAAPSYTPPPANRDSIKLALMREKTTEAMLNFYRKFIEDWDELPADRKKAALEVIEAYRRKVRPLYARMHAGQPVSEQEAMETWNLIPVLPHIMEALADPQWIVQFQQRFQAWGRILTPFADPTHPAQAIRRFLAPLKLDEKQQRQVDQLADEYEQQVNQLRKKIEKTDKVPDALKAEQFSIDRGLLTMQTWEKIEPLLTPAQRQALDEILKAKHN